jgi:hypothetical protein
MVELALFVNEVVVVSVPPLTFTIPLLVKVVGILRVLPLTVKIPVLLTVTLLAVDATAFTVTVCVAAMVTLSIAVGTTLPTQVPVASQSPVAKEVIKEPCSCTTS